MKKTTKFALTAALLLVLAQFVPVPRTNPPVTGEIQAPPEVAAILKRSCYDCHSHETRWPWYSRLAPASWLLAFDVISARKEVNFSTWQELEPGKRRHKFDDIREEVEEGNMPLGRYLLLHPGARLNAVDRERLVSWAAGDRPQDQAEN